MVVGLYKDVVKERTKSMFLFHGASILRWVFMLLQLCISAVLTALGSADLKDGTPITVLGAINTISSGILAFLHNSGLPDRYRYDMDEYREVEDHIKELLDSGIAPAELSLEQILAECFDLYQDAKATVTANMPENYRTRQTLPVRRQEQDQPAPTDRRDPTSTPGQAKGGLKGPRPLERTKLPNRNYLSKMVYEIQTMRNVGESWALLPVARLGKQVELLVHAISREEYLCTHSP